MLVRILAYRVLLRLLRCAIFLCAPAFGQRPIWDLPTNALGKAESTSSNELSPSLSLDVYLQGPDQASVEEPAALTLLSAERQLCKQGTTKQGHLRWNDLAPMQYEILVFAPGFERVVRLIDAQSTGEVRVIVPLRPSTSKENDYPPFSADPEVNFIFGVYASRLGDRDQAKTYWRKVLELSPDFVPAMVSISEVLLTENKAAEALGYLDRATKADPSNWRTHSVLAEAYLRAGSFREAVQHAERALELGKGEASSVPPLLARALLAEAAEVLRTYLQDHPGDVAARKQLEGMNSAPELHASDHWDGGPGGRHISATAGKPAPAPTGSQWLPPDVDDDVPPVEPGSTCNLQEVLQKTGERMQEFVENVARFTATESLLYESINKSGEVSGKEKRKYDYVVSIEEIRPGILGVEEYQSSGATSDKPPGGVVTKGLPALPLIFHPYYSGNFSMKCEGLTTVNGEPAWQIYFRQREDKPNQTRAYRIGVNGPAYPVDLKGRAWFMADSYQIVKLQSDLIKAIPGIQLAIDHTAIEYGPVHFGSRGVDMWLPINGELYSDRKGRRFHERISFSDYLLFAVDDRQKISSPKTSP
jgi:tetratricopeptide (TPR) repeat protein